MYRSNSIKFIEFMNTINLMIEIFTENLLLRIKFNFQIRRYMNQISKFNELLKFGDSDPLNVSNLKFLYNFKKI